MTPRQLSKFIACLTLDNALTPSHGVKTGWQETVKPTTLKQALANRGGLWRWVVGATMLWRAPPPLSQPRLKRNPSGLNGRIDEDLRNVDGDRQPEEAAKHINGRLKSDKMRKIARKMPKRPHEQLEDI
jgi:hypothetical protein